MFDLSDYDLEAIFNEGSYYPEFLECPDTTTLKQDGRYIEAMSVMVEKEEYAVCVKGSLGENYWANSKPGDYGQGLLRESGDEYKTVRTGLLGQMAFAKLFHDRLDVKYREFGDEFDNLIDQYKIDIKCAARNYGRTLVRCSGRGYEINKDYYVGGFVEREEREYGWARVVMVGWVDKAYVLNQPRVDAIRGSHKNKEMWFSEMRPLTELMEILNHGRAKKTLVAGSV